MPRISLYIAAAFLSGGVSSLNAQISLCMPPVAPLLPASLETQIEYKAELTREFIDYFSFAEGYLNCLNESGSATRNEVAKTIESYSVLLNLPSPTNLKALQ